MIGFSDLLLNLKDYGIAAKLYLSANHAWLPGAVVAAFTLVNSVRVLVYVPQIVAAARDANGASGISYVTWALFLISHLTTIAYAVVYLGDAVVALLFFGNALACLAIIAITVVKRRWHAPSRCKGLRRLQAIGMHWSTDNQGQAAPGEGRDTSDAVARSHGGYCVRSDCGA